MNSKQCDSKIRNYITQLGTCPILLLAVQSQATFKDFIEFPYEMKQCELLILLYIYSLPNINFVLVNLLKKIIDSVTLVHNINKPSKLH